MSPQRTKIILLGQKGAGKTCLVRRLKFGQFSEDVQTTIGGQRYECDIRVGEAVAPVEVWDTAGEERFRAMVPLFFRGARIALVVYSVASPSSLDDAQYWVKELRKQLQGQRVGNKIDLESRSVSQAQGQKLGEKLSVAVKEASAKSNDGIDDLFAYIGNIALDVSSEQADEASAAAQQSVNLQAAGSRQRSCCSR